MGKNKYLYITLLAVLGFQQEAVAQIVASTPRLVVNITIDQLRTDYLDAFTPLYNADGFRKLLGKGIVYEAASYPFEPVDRATATATIATGTTPYYHGIIGNRWLDRSTLRPLFCVDDPQHFASPHRLMTSTFGDELKVRIVNVDIQRRQIDFDLVEE